MHPTTQLLLIGKYAEGYFNFLKGIYIHRRKIISDLVYHRAGNRRNSVKESLGYILKNDIDMLFEVKIHLKA